MFFACGIWRLADILSASLSLEQTEGLWGNLVNSVELTYTLGTIKLKKGKNRYSFSNSGLWLPTESMNDFHSPNFKHDCF